MIPNPIALTTPCILCGSIQHTRLFSGPDRLVGLPGTFTLVRCSNCGLIYQAPRPGWEALRPHYEAEYPMHTTLDQQATSPRRRWLLRLGSRKQRRYVERFCRGGRLLDVGCGAGDFLAEMQTTQRWALFGLEPTSATAQATARRLGLPVIPARVEDTSLLPASLDVVTMWNVIEHLDAPLDVLRRIWAALKPGGYLVLATPNPTSFSRYLFGQYWVGWELPRHLFLYTPAVLERMLTVTGFKSVDQHSFMGSYTVLGMSLAFLAQGWPAALRPLARGMQRLHAAPITRLALYPAQLLTERLNRSTIISWAAQKVGV